MTTKWRHTASGRVRLHMPSGPLGSPKMYHMRPDMEKRRRREEEKREEEEKGRRGKRGGREKREEEEERRREERRGGEEREEKREEEGGREQEGREERRGDVPYATCHPDRWGARRWRTRPDAVWHHFVVAGRFLAVPMPTGGSQQGIILG